jgi:threonine aldolase
MMKKLGEKYLYSQWQKIDKDHTAVRFCTSWATTEKNVKQLIEDITTL